MKKMHINSKGITLIALVVTIIVLLILASIATYSGIQIIESSKITTFTTEMKIMQTHVNSIYDQWKKGEVNKDELGKDLEYNSEVKEQASKVLTTELGIKDTTGYRYYDQAVDTGKGWFGFGVCDASGNGYGGRDHLSVRRNGNTAGSCNGKSSATGICACPGS